MRFACLLLFSVACLAACAQPAAAPAPDTGGIDLSVPAERRDPLAGFTPCPRDEAAACGVSRVAPEGNDEADEGNDVPPSATVSETVWNVPVGPVDPTLGPAEALVTMVVFSDFECPFCRRHAATLRKIVADRPREVRLVWKDYPLPMHANAQDASHFARAVRAQGGDSAFWTAHDRLFEAQADLGHDTYTAIARDISGLDWNAIKRDLRDRRHGLAIHEDIQLGDALEIAQTPTTFVNGRRLVGAQPRRDFEALIDEELTKAKKLVAGGVPTRDVYARIMSSGRQVAPIRDEPVP